MLLDKPKDTSELIYQIGVSNKDREYHLEKKEFDPPEPKFEPDKIESPFIGV